jgi:uncharacterized protein (TIGR03435 family)
MNGIELLGATLLHFLWQGVLIAGAYAAARRWASRPEFRYLLACAALAAMAASPVATWIALRPVPAKVITLADSVPASHWASAVSGFRSDLPRLFAVGVERVPSVWLSWVAVAWMVGVVVFWLRLLGGWMIAERLRRRHVRPAPHQWQQAFDGFRVRLRVPRPVQLLVSGLVQAPAVVGLLRPVVLVPVGALAGLPPEQMEALLLHELAHIRRYDYLVNALQNMVEALLFYHPAVWWVSGHMRYERELCCDDAAVTVTGDAQSYARALAEVGAAGHADYQAAVAATGGSLANRVARLLGEPRSVSRRHSPSAVAAAAALVALTVMAAPGQTVRPKFEVASIKPVGGRGAATMRPLPGRLTANASLRVLMQSAYQLQPFQIVGGPEWIGSQQYDIDAKAAGNPDRAQMFLMLQSLLEDRFQLRVHRESQEMPVYAMVAARGGLKLPSLRDGSCMEDTELLGPLTETGAQMQPPGQGVATTSSRCGGLDVTLEASGARMRGSKVPMVEFVRVLSRVLGRTVTDQTGFSGAFDVDLDFLPDETTVGLPPPPPGAIPFAVASPSIFSAVQQLGLRLESAKGPVEVLVIDQVERPSAN